MKEPADQDTKVLPMSPNTCYLCPWSPHPQRGEGDQKAGPLSPAGGGPENGTPLPGGRGPESEAPLPGGRGTGNQCSSEAICCWYCSRVMRWSRVTPSSSLILTSQPPVNGSCMMKLGSLSSFSLT